MEQVTLPGWPERQEISLLIEKSATFHPHTQVLLFLPMDVEDTVPPNHVVRVVNDAVDRLDDALWVDKQLS